MKAWLCLCAVLLLVVGCAEDHDAALQAYKNEIELLDGLKARHDDLEANELAELGRLAEMVKDGPDNTTQREQIAELQGKLKGTLAQLETEIDRQVERVRKAKARLDATSPRK